MQHVALAHEKQRNPQKITGNPYWHSQREVHTEAFKSFCYYIDETIISNKEVFQSSRLNKFCQQLLVEIGGNDFHGIVTTTQKLEEKLKKKYPELVILYSVLQCL